MKYELLSPNDLSTDLVATWSDLHRNHREFDSPYFSPPFTEIVAACRDDVRIGVLSHSNTIAGLFPFHYRRGGLGRPIGLKLSDYHGVIAETDSEWTPEDLLRGCGLIRYEFDHLLARQPQFAMYHHSVEDSPIIELRDGYEGFENSRDKAGRKQLREIERKRAKFETEVSQLQFVQHTESTDVLRTLMDWKSEQCRQTGTFDYFSLRWCRELIERIHANDSPVFGSVLSCLYAGDELAAAHFVMRTDRVWHSWFPVYNNHFHQYSPGLILLVEMVRAAATNGIDYIDLGKDVSTYKKRFMTDSIQVAQGCVELPSLVNKARHLRAQAEQWSRSSVFRPVLRLPGRLIKSIERRSRYD